MKEDSRTRKRGVKKLGYSMTDHSFGRHSQQIPSLGIQARPHRDVYLSSYSMRPLYSTQ